MKIQYLDKEDLVTKVVPDKNKVTASNMNEIKEAVNDNDDKIEELRSNQIVGIFAFSTFVELPETGEVLKVYKITNDPDSTLNGFYHWNGSVYIKDADLVENVIEESNTSVGVSGVAVYNFLNSNKDDSITKDSDKIATSGKVYEFLKKQSVTKIENRRLKLSSLSEIPIGIIDLTEIGVTYNNPFNLLFYSDGAIVYPMKKIDNNFHKEWEEGGINYLDHLTGDRYKSISVAKMHDPTIGVDINTYYSDYETGVNTTTDSQGLSEEKPFKSLRYAVETAKNQFAIDSKPFNIILLDNFIGSDGTFGSVWKTFEDGVKGKITGKPKNGGKTIFSSQRESYTDVLFDWQDAGSGVWKCVTTSINEASKKSPIHFDTLNRDIDGAPTPLKYIPEESTEALTLTKVQENPSSFATYTNGGVSTLYLHFIDKRKPTIENWIYSEGGSQMSFSIGEGAVCFLENIERIQSPANVSQAAIRVRPINVPASYLTHTGQFWLYNCGVFGASGESVQFYDIQYGGTDWLTTKYCRKDAENYHSFNNAGYTPNNQGDFMRMWSNHTLAEHIGNNFFRDQLTVTESNQISSSHDKIPVTRLNMIGGYTYGSVIADVSGAQTLSINCHPYYPTLAQGLASPKTCYWVDGAGTTQTTIMDLVYCSGLNYPNSNIFSATNGGIINHYKHIGETTSEITNVGVINEL